MNTRELILEILLAVTVEREFSHVVIRNVLDKYDYLSAQEKSFIKRTTEGTLERMIQIDYIIDLFSSVKVNKMKPVIRNILRMSVYQILYMDSIPDSAACNEAVKLAERKHFHQLKGFVNGVLRTIARQREQIAYPDKQTNPIAYYSVVYSMPEWLVTMWRDIYDETMLEKLLQGLLAEHPVTLHLCENIPKAEKELWYRQVKDQGISITRHPYLSYAYQISGAEGTAGIPLFAEGMVTVQDVSSMLIGEIAGVEKGDMVIDVCAAPGGKSLHISEKLQETGHVDARDVSERKTELILENVRRMKRTNISVRVRDAAVEYPEDRESADILLADVPCSGLGVMGKKRDIKYRVTAESIKEITGLQRQILRTVQAYVKKGGTLIYSTCTIQREENEEMVEWFLQNFPFVLESIDPFLPEILHSETTARGYLQLLPGIHEADGFFMARLKCEKKLE